VHLHEAIHFLKAAGFFEPREWQALTRAARQQDWIKKYNIDSLYRNESIDVQLEEAIAHAYPLEGREAPSQRSSRLREAT